MVAKALGQDDTGDLSNISRKGELYWVVGANYASSALVCLISAHQAQARARTRLEMVGERRPG
jgi:hypothetical protein